MIISAMSHVHDIQCLLSLTIPTRVDKYQVLMVLKYPFELIDLYMHDHHK
jgi:hypothetical protein